LAISQTVARSESDEAIQSSSWLWIASLTLASDEKALHQPYGFGTLEVQAPPEHFRFDAATTVLGFFGCVTSGIGLVAADVWSVGVALPVEPGVGTPIGEFGLAMPITGPGFGGPGGVIGLIAPPITGAGLGALPTVLCCVLAPPIVLCAPAGEMPAAATPIAHVNVHPMIALLFMRASHVRGAEIELNVVRPGRLAKGCARSNVLLAHGSRYMRGLNSPARLFSSYYWAETEHPTA
jgi:hypothetical protein